MEKTITIGNREITMKATANTPKRYRNEFNKDLLIELQNLFNHLDKKTGEFVGQVDLSLVENLAYIMAKQADPEIGTQDDFLDQFEVADIYNAMPQILGVWSTSTETLSTAKKK